MKKIYVVTGAFGHLGYNLVNKLLELNNEVVAFDLNTKENVFDKKVQIFKGNVCNKPDIDKLFKSLNNYQINVIHCAGIVSIASKYDKRVYDVNVLGTKNVVDACLKYKVNKLIHVSSVHAIKELKNNHVIKEVSNFSKDDVNGLYAKTKAEASQYVLDSTKKGLNAVVVHPSGIIGPYDYNIGHTTRLIVDYVNGRLTAAIKGGYDFVDVRDVVDGIISCVDKGTSNECYILSNRYVSIKELLDTLHDISGRKKIKTYLPLWFIKPLAPLAETYYKIVKTKPLFTSYSLYTLNSNANFSHEKADKELGYKTRPIKDTLKDTYDWLKKENIVK